ncbi:MAG TPA: hypothetical protein VGH38_25815 [Bryobacteraceae bacterium]
MQPLAILFGAAFTVAVSMALGSLLLGRASGDPAIRLVAGGALLSLSVFALCAAGVVWPWVFVAGGVGAIAAAGWRMAVDWAAPKLPRILLALFALYFVLYFLNSMEPEFSFDGSRYHLALVGRYLREHGFHPITDNMYASLSQGVEMLYLFAYAFGKHSAASMVHFGFLLALAWLMFSYAGRIGFPLAGGCAAVLVFASPMAGVDGTSAYIDVAVAAIAFALFYLLQIWKEERSPRLLIAIGLVAGFAYAAKYTAWLAVPYAVGFVAWKSRSRRDVSVVALCAAAMILPWMVKNWIWVANPLAPFFNQWFPNPYVTISFEREYRAGLALSNLTSRWQIPLQVTTFGSLSGLLGPVFLLAPVALLSLRRHEGRQLLLAGAVFGANYFSNIGTRFLLPPLPFIALAMMLVLAAKPRLAIGIAVLHALISWPSVVGRYCHPDAWRLVKIPWREALRIKPEDGVLRSNLPFYGAARMVEQSAAPGSTIFTFTPIPDAYTARKVLVAYQSAANITSRAVFFTGYVPEYAPTWALRFAFERQPLRSLRVVQTNSGGDSWSIHDLRIFDGAAELPRDSGWRLTARPNPWGIGNIMDDRPLSFWMASDTLRPGQLVQMDFPSEQVADSVLIRAAPNQYGIRLELQGSDAFRDWHLLAAEPEIGDLPPPPNLRRAAARELKRRGIDYLLLFDGEFGAEDVDRHTDLWGVSRAGEYKGAKLYQLP